ncbi:MAG: peptidoglycan bridge formation glycyltransferase FemA/FemB family protein [Algibacter sp.]|uniref:peptidoglycan bridge formation glycyltransferase FemA/FemB family protein n=1 Tax=Algibacter sp. TaxID=1872428 RepID=UPI00262688B8|nr:peptidoglycan bridge formation glycyltransferase FemA/FemB family protein [Algibacter sp.]MDG1728590.1 peptidoglycan bridge formation glycyltransferase FemA/FemB family protein [Algibacter sp.]MDG2178530.1 peptidoglycan bridge formation glycyltransferase FemA/FemB family protein [Algibacter sp.]
MKIEILREKIEWDEFLQSVDDYDFYHTFDYHHISKSESDEAVLIKYTNGEIFIGLPLLIRKIKSTDYYDAISVYGYSGPIGSRTPLNFNKLNYEKTLLDFFNKKKIVTVFVRLNPYLTFQNILFSNLGESFYFGELCYLGKIVNINTSKPLKSQRKKYQRRLKTHINKANRLLTLKIAETKEDFQHFKILYYKNMERVKARESYFFSDEYFEKFNTSKDFKTEVLLAIDNETKKIIAGCMFVKTNTMVQYHLSGSDENYLHLNGIKFLIDQMRIKASNEGYNNFNLGGGLGANENDSLFRFKASFSDEYHPFFVWKLITNATAYKEICKKNKINYKSSTFFPMYRLNE